MRVFVFLMINNGSILGIFGFHMAAVTATRVKFKTASRPEFYRFSLVNQFRLNRFALAHTHTLMSIYTYIHKSHKYAYTTARYKLRQNVRSVRRNLYTGFGNKTTPRPSNIRAYFDRGN